jgi:hypothetical protein
LAARRPARCAAGWLSRHRLRVLGANQRAFPVRRLGLAFGQGADAPGAYVRAEDLRIERLEQRYVRLEDHERGRRFAYAAPVFDFTCVLAYDDAGLLLDYPGIALRAA